MAETTVYDQTKCLPEKKSNPGGPCIMKIQNGHTIIEIPTDRIVSKLRDLQRISIWRSVPNTGELTSTEMTELETNLGKCDNLTDESFELLERLIGVGESGDEAGTIDIDVTKKNITILQQCELISGAELNELDRLLEKKGGKRKSRKSKSKKARKSKKNKSRKTKSRKSKSHKK